jgi:long-chain acyl-CoA synthetase
MSIAQADEQLTAPGQLFETCEIDAPGIRTTVWKNCPPTLRDILSISRGYGEVDFIVYEDERLTFEQHFRTSAHLAGILRDRFGIRAGDRVAIAMRNLPEWSLAFWAATVAGAVAVPLNAWWTGEELHYGLADSGTRVVLCDEERADRLTDYLMYLPDIHAVVVARAGRDLPIGMLRFEEVVGEVPPVVELPTTELHPDDDATIFYTSGTTGRPKGALGTHRNICTNPMSLFYVATRTALREESGLEGGPQATGAKTSDSGTTARAQPPESGQTAFLLSVPLFHATGCHSILVANTLAGGKLVLMRRWDPGRALELIEREAVTNFGGVPTMVMQILDHPDFATRDTSSVRGVGYGGAPAPPDLVRRIKAHFPGVGASNGYGLTETSALSTMNSGADYEAKPDSVGPPVPVVSVKVVDPAGAEVPVGEVGELWVKGPNVVKGYWENPKATAESFSDGWLHTGDVARVDEDNFVYIVDRAKDMLIRGGENVYCVEIESVLHEHPAVADAAIIGIPDPLLGEEVGAVVHVRPGMSLSDADIQEHVASRLAAFKVPVRIWFSDKPLPRNPTGKLLKRQLRDELVGASVSNVSPLSPAVTTGGTPPTGRGQGG